MVGELTAAWLTVPLFLPRLAGPNEYLFALAVFAAAIAILTGIHPELFLGIGLLIVIMYMVDLAGVSPALAVMIILLAGLIRAAGLGMGHVIGQVSTAGEDLMVLAAGLIDALASRRGGDREDD